MNFLSHNLPLAPDADCNVASLLFDAIATTFGARHEALQRRRLVNVNGCYLQLIDVSAIVVFGIRNRRLKSFLDNPGTLFRTECQDIERLRHRQTADLISHQATFLRGQMNIFCNCSSRCHHAPLFFDCRFFISRMPLECARQGKFAQLVTNHVFGYVHRDMLLTVMHRDCQADEFGKHRGTARPGFNRAFVIGCTHHLNLLEQVCVDKWTFFNGTCHVYLPLKPESDGAQSYRWCACCDEYGNPWPAHPTD